MSTTVRCRQRSSRRPLGHYRSRHAAGTPRSPCRAAVLPLQPGARIPDAIREIGNGIVGAPRLMTTVTAVPGCQRVRGRPEHHEPASCGRLDRLTCSRPIRRRISDGASPPVEIRHAGTGILRWAAARHQGDFRSFRGDDAGGGSCQMTDAGGRGRVRLGAPSVTCNWIFGISDCASASVSRARRGTVWDPAGSARDRMR